jgi:RNase H-fold protein (predicted Holliday junction resolvase)
VSRAVLGIDPGTRKVGFALVEDMESPAIARGIEPLESLVERIAPLLAQHPISAVALGSGTNATRLARMLESLGVPVHVIDETDTTYRARALYFAEHPPRGWRRLLPLGLQVPPGPIDDYAAMLIARRYLARGA